MSSVICFARIKPKTGKRPEQETADMVTIYDVAERAGVSPKTVSRVLNRDAPVSVQTRAAVEAAMGELGYIPSSAARIMRSNRSELVGVITGAVSRSDCRTGGLPDMFLVQGIQCTMAAAGKTVMIADTGNRSGQIEPLMRTFMAHRAEGILYVAEFHQETELPDFKPGCPLVLVNCFDSRGTPSVIPDDEQGQYDLVAQIIAGGHRRIAYLSLQPQVIASRLRRCGYRRALENAGIAYDAGLDLAGYPDYRNRSTALLAAVEKLLALPEPPTVLCCGNDEMAVRVYGILRSQGIKVPEEISVAGYDNHRAIAETLFPPLTTADLPYTAMGALAAQMLLDAVAGKPLPAEPVVVPGATVWRQSVTGKQQP